MGIGLAAWGMAWAPLHADDLVVQSFSSNGELTWTHPTLEVEEYRVEWASAATGPWTDTWANLRGLLPTGATMSATVPMLYRVVAAIHAALIPVASLSLDRNAATLCAGGTLRLVATVLPADASNGKVAWTSSVPEVAQVSQDGLVTARSAGSAILTASSEEGGKTDACAITVPDVLDVTSFGAVGDGLAEDKDAIDAAILAARAAGKDVYFPNGTYLYHSPANWNGVRFHGQSREGAVIEGSSREEHNLDGAENLTFRDVRITDYMTTKSRIFRNCTFVATVQGDQGFYFFYTGAYTWGADNEFTDCDFLFNDIYAALWIRKYDSVLIRNCRFIGQAFHNIRLSEPNIPRAQTEILGNHISGGTTGIFIGSDRVAPMEGGRIEGNTLQNQTQEAISLDGIGNDPGLIAVIANGPISGATNDASGNLVIGMDQMVHGVYIDAAGNVGFVPAPVSLRHDWTNFYFSFGEGSGREGTIAQIVAADPVANTLALDLGIPASEVHAGGKGGVQGGFFDWTIRGNTLTGALGNGNTYGTAISVYLNAFGTLIESNLVRDCAHGINLAGGLMFGGYDTLAYNNVIRGNSFIDCDRYAIGDPSEETGVVRIISYWSGSGAVQYGNRFVGNTVVGGRVFIERQGNFTFEDNQFQDVNCVMIPVAQ